MLTLHLFCLPPKNLELLANNGCMYYYVYCMYTLHFQRETYFQNHGASIYNDIDTENVSPIPCMLIKMYVHIWRIYLV